MLRNHPEFLRKNQTLEILMFWKFGQSHPFFNKNLGSDKRIFKETCTVLIKICFWLRVLIAYHVIKLVPSLGLWKKFAYFLFRSPKNFGLKSQGVDLIWNSAWRKFLSTTLVIQHLRCTSKNVSLWCFVQIGTNSLTDKLF